MLLGAIPDVGVPAVAWVARREALHEQIADGLGEDGRGGDGLAAGIAVHQRVVRVADLGERQAVDQDAMRGVARGERRLLHQPGDRAAHGQRGRDPDVEAVDLAGRRGPDGEGERPFADPPGQLEPDPRRQDLAVAQPADRAAADRKDDGRGHHWTSQWAAARFIDADEQKLFGPCRPLPLQRGAYWPSAQPSRFSRIRAALPLSARR